jgi:hypothetical protein
MLLFPKWACALMLLGTLGVLRAEDAVIYGTTPGTKASGPTTLTPASQTTASVEATKGTVSEPGSTSRSTVSAQSDSPSLSVNDQPITQVVLAATEDIVVKEPSNFAWKRKIVTTTFWVGQDANGYNDTTNYKSAWDANWTETFGGTDNPTQRFGFLPKGRFAVTQNPFYVALPFNDVKFPELARKWVPWYNKDFAKNNPYVSQCKGRWVEIQSQSGKVCYAQWQDVGPFRYDHAAYVFGKERPSTFNRAGLDVSPAVKTMLGLCGLDQCDWRFVEAWEVPHGPWITYGEQAILMAAIKRREQDKKTEAASGNTASTRRVSSRSTASTASAAD